MVTRLIVVNRAGFLCIISKLFIQTHVKIVCDAYLDFEETLDKVSEPRLDWGVKQQRNTRPSKFLSCCCCLVVVVVVMMMMMMIMMMMMMMMIS